MLNFCGLPSLLLFTAWYLFDFISSFTNKLGQKRNIISKTLLIICAVLLLTFTLISVICSKNGTRKIEEYLKLFNTKQFVYLDEKDVSRYNEEKATQCFVFGDTFAVDERADMEFPANLVVDDTYTTERETHVKYHNYYAENLPEFLTDILYNGYLNAQKSPSTKEQEIQYGDSISGSMLTFNYYSDLYEKTDTYGKSICVFLKDDNKILCVAFDVFGEEDILLNQDYIVEKCLESFEKY